MRVVLDTNILVSALLVQLGNSAAVYRAWQEGYFTLWSVRTSLTSCGPRSGNPLSRRASSHTLPVVWSTS
jgi:predicted nucleic acid-binding protein